MIHWSLFTFNLLVIFPLFSLSEELIPARIPNLKEPSCVRHIQTPEAKDYIFTFTQLLTRENIKTQALQKTYLEGLNLYLQSLSKAKEKSERLCILTTLIALFENPTGTAAPEIFADWYNAKITTRQKENQFKQDLTSLKDKNDPSDFAEQILVKLESYSAGDL